MLGMFELNNLAVLVASPTENFFVEADGANKAADESTEPPLDTLMLLAALGDDYQTPCEGTGFYALQVGGDSASHGYISTGGRNIDARTRKDDRDSTGRETENSGAPEGSRRTHPPLSRRGGAVEVNIAVGVARRTCRAAAITAACRRQRRSSLRSMPQRWRWRATLCWWLRGTLSRERR